MEELGTDVVIQDHIFPELLDVLADFVWQQRGLANDLDNKHEELEIQTSR